MKIRKAILAIWAIKDIIEGFPYIKKMKNGVVNLLAIFK